MTEQLRAKPKQGGLGEGGEVCKTLPYAEPLLLLTPRGPAEPTGLPDHLGPPRELLKITFCQALPVHYPSPEHQVGGNHKEKLAYYRQFGIKNTETIIKHHTHSPVAAIST